MLNSVVVESGMVEEHERPDMVDAEGEFRRKLLVLLWRLAPTALGDGAATTTPSFSKTVESDRMVATRSLRRCPELRPPTLLKLLRPPSLVGAGASAFPVMDGSESDLEGIAICVY